MLTILGQFFLALSIFSVKAPVVSGKLSWIISLFFCSGLVWFSYLRALIMHILDLFCLLSLAITSLIIFSTYIVFFFFFIFSLCDSYFFSCYFLLRSYHFHFCFFFFFYFCPNSVNSCFISLSLNFCFKVFLNKVDFFFFEFSK